MLREKRQKERKVTKKRTSEEREKNEYATHSLND